METGDDRVNADYELSRSRRLALFMEIAEQSQGTLSAAEDLHRLFATGQLPDDHASAVPHELEHSFEVWKLYQERQYVKLSVYALWHEAVQRLAYEVFRIATVQQLLSHFNVSLGKFELAVKWLGAGNDRGQPRVHRPRGD